MGWNGESGLGKNGTGIREPVKATSTFAMLGLGKMTEYIEAAQAATSERKKLEVELEETPELLKKRQEKKEQVEAIQQELTEINKVTRECLPCVAARGTLLARRVLRTASTVCALLMHFLLCCAAWVCAR
jgi:hypothetical protein